VVADIAHIGGTKYGVADSVYQYIGIAVAQQSHFMFQFDTAHPQFATFH
jgi:hypothetical protein